jgi:uncharacterized protein YjgD (DUF1641 family)
MEPATQEQIDAVNRKLDLILEEMELQRRHRREMDDLKDDLMRVARDAYQSALVELEEVHDHLQTGDMLFFAKKLLRNITTLTRMFEQVEGMKDFFEDFAPISRELFIDAMHKLDEFDRKGYFAFLHQLSQGLDNIVTSFTPDDVRLLNENLVTILNTIKNLTQPDMLQAVNNAVAVYKHLDFDVREDPSLFALLRQINAPETRRGLALALRFLQNLSQQQPDDSRHIASPTAHHS